MQMTKIYCFPSFALDLAHVKFDVLTRPSGSKRETQDNKGARCGSEITCNIICLFVP